MREALARSDHDFVLAAPRARKPARSGKSGVLAFAAPLLRYPGRTLAGVILAGVLAGILANALFLQTARHPAPLFSGPVVAAKQALPANPPLPAPRPATAQQTAPLPPMMAARENIDQQKDQIGALLKSTSQPPADNVQRVLAAQKALVKLGYIVKADGVMGASTRQAIQLFEQSRKLPVTGELSPRVAREISALSGIAVP